MPNLSFTIANPVLIAGQSFKVRYRTLPAGSFGSQTVFTSNTISYVGLSAGDYEFEIIWFNGSEDCPATYRYITVAGAPTPSCLSFSAELEQNGLLYELVLTYPPPSPVGWPPCGYKVRIIQGSNTQNITLASLSLTGEQRFTVPNYQGLQVIVTADYCNNVTLECLNADVPGIIPECEPIVILDTEIIRDTMNPDEWVITITYNQSNPFTLSTTIFYAQNPSQVAPGRTPDTGTYTGVVLFPSGGTDHITVRVRPAIGQWSVPNYTGYMTDHCGNQILWSV